MVKLNVTNKLFMPQKKLRTSLQETKKILDNQLESIDNQKFIKNDPISVPHSFSSKKDIEISAFLSSLMAWGIRKTIIAKSKLLMQLMDNAPSDFIMNSTDTDLKKFSSFVHRTFSSADCIFYIKSLINIYRNHGGLENIFTAGYEKNNNIKDAIHNARLVIFDIKHDRRCERHVSDVSKNSAAKRINMFLRWMIRKDGIDFGLWKNIDAAHLMLPLDVHTARVSRQLCLLTRKSNDWIAVEEVTRILREFDNKDPVKYDLALFSLGAEKHI